VEPQKGKPAPQNPWNDNGLEWSLPSPAPHGNWEKVPTVYRGPYEFSSPQAAEDYLPQYTKLPTDREPARARSRATDRGTTDDARSRHRRSDAAPYPAERGLDVYNKKLGMWVFLASEVMFFAALIGTYVILRFGATASGPSRVSCSTSRSTALNTFLLICSSVSMVKAYAAIQDGDPKKMRFWLLMTILGGAAFVGIQVYEYIHLIEHGFLRAGCGGQRAGGAVANGTLPRHDGPVRLHVLHDDGVPRLSRDVRRHLDGLPVLHQGAPGKYTKQDYGASKPSACTGTSSIWCGSSCSPSSTDLRG